MWRLTAPYGSLGNAEALLQDLWLEDFDRAECKRDDLSVYLLRNGERPTCSSVRRCSPARHRLPMVLFKLSKLPNQEDALSAPWLCGGLGSPQTSSRTQSAADR